MAATLSKMIELGTFAKDFSLPDTNGKIVHFRDFDASPAKLICFICNHCPYVKHILPELTRLGNEFVEKGVAVFAINSNDVSRYPEDRPEKMAELKHDSGIEFPYLFDEAQDVARDYGAACTPDFYVFDRCNRLVYRGQFDDSRPGNQVPVTGLSIRSALEGVLSGKPIDAIQKPSIGCNIKWR